MQLDRLTQVPGVVKEQSQGGRGSDNLHNKLVVFFLFADVLCVIDRRKCPMILDTEIAIFD